MMYIIYKKDNQTGVSSLVTRGIDPATNESLENLLSLMFDDADEEMDTDDVPVLEAADEFMKHLSDYTEKHQEEPNIELRDLIRNSIIPGVLEPSASTKEEQEIFEDIMKLKHAVEVEVEELKGNIVRMREQLIRTNREKVALEEECALLKSERDSIHRVLQDIIKRK